MHTKPSPKPNFVSQSSKIKFFSKLFKQKILLANHAIEKSETSYLKLKIGKIPFSLKN